MAWKNRIYEIILKFIDLKFSDIHLVENWNMRVRNATWLIVEVPNTQTSRDDIYAFTEDFLSEEQWDLILDWNEIDTSFTIQKSRFRINIYMDMNWVRLAMRKITSLPPSLNDIWFDDSIKNFLTKDKWLILLTWPTGSWKSTSLAAMVDYINKTRAVHILTLEDPIEFIYQNDRSLITQREVWKVTKTWWNSLKYAMRQDPDVILVWEMRDLETIRAALTLVETWHLVLSTLHTVDAAQTITRIIDVFPPSQQEQIAIQLSLSLELIISQRLIPLKDSSWRVASREILVNTKAISNNIRERRIPQIVSIMETWYKFWMNTMDQSLATLVAKWLVDINTALPQVKSIDSFNMLLKWLTDEKRNFNPID
jgi:twitching motility protein PilT